LSCPKCTSGSSSAAIKEKQPIRKTKITTKECIISYILKYGSCAGERNMVQASSRINPLKHDNGRDPTGSNTSTQQQEESPWLSTLFFSEIQYIPGTSKKASMGLRRRHQAKPMAGAANSKAAPAATPPAIAPVLVVC